MYHSKDNRFQSHRCLLKHGATRRQLENVLLIESCVLQMIVSKANSFFYKPFGGDGWCDTINNRAYCQYDGGDCCPSTLSTKKVKLNPLKAFRVSDHAVKVRKPCESLLLWLTWLNLFFFHRSFKYSSFFHICSGT